MHVQPEGEGKDPAGQLSHCKQAAAEDAPAAIVPYPAGQYKQPPDGVLGRTLYCPAGQRLHTVVADFAARLQNDPGAQLELMHADEELAPYAAEKVHRGQLVQGEFEFVGNTRPTTVE